MYVSMSYNSSYLYSGCISNVVMCVLYLNLNCVWSLVSYVYPLFIFLDELSARLYAYAGSDGRRGAA